VSAPEKFHFHLLQAAEKVTVNPSPDGLPGVGALQKLLNGAAALALMACVAAFVIGAAQWGFGSRSQNYSQAADGKERMLKSVGGAFAIGGVAAIINFFYKAGTGVA
jgi:uncharacterized protein DUF6112